MYYNATKEKPACCKFGHIGWWCLAGSLFLPVSYSPLCLPNAKYYNRPTEKSAYCKSGHTGWCLVGSFVVNVVVLTTAYIKMLQQQSKRKACTLWVWSYRMMSPIFVVMVVSPSMYLKCYCNGSKESLHSQFGRTGRCGAQSLLLWLSHQPRMCT